MARSSSWILLTNGHITETFIPDEGDKWQYLISPNLYIRKDDTVYLWSTIFNCFFGWGEVLEHPRIILESEKPDVDARKRQLIVVKRKKPFNPRITQQIMERSPNLKRLIPTGFNDLEAIPLRPGQANYINDFVREYGLEPPDGSEAVKITYEETAPQFMTKAILKFGEKTDEGQLIETVLFPWFDIIEKLLKDPKLAYEIPPRKWEEIIAGVYEQSGFDKVILTPYSNDRGRDVIAIKYGVGEVRIIDQVKAYHPGNLVKADDVRALLGVLQLEPASKGFLTTTSNFAPGIWTDPFIAPLIPQKLSLINGDKLIQRLVELRRK